MLSDRHAELAASRQEIHDARNELQSLQSKLDLARIELAQVAKWKHQAAHSLANNLCPDHRDKQRGKPCLACEIESLQATVERNQRATHSAVEAAAQHAAERDAWRKAARFMYESADGGYSEGRSHSSPKDAYDKRTWQEIVALIGAASDLQDLHAAAAKEPKQ